MHTSSFSLKAFVARILAVTALLSLALPALAQELPYQDVVVRFITTRNVHQSALADKLAEVAADLGIMLEVRFVTTDQLARKVVLDYVGGADTWDLVYTGGVQRMYEWHNRGIIDEVNPYIEEFGEGTLEWDLFTQGARDAVTFEDKVLGLPVATSDQALAYREDLFTHADEMAAFEEEYGYELSPPATYDEFYDVAEFFTREAGEQLAGETLQSDFYGTSFSNKKGTYVWHDYQNQILAFGVQLYNPETGEAEFASPESIEAAEYYASLVPFLPANHINQSSGESTAVFADGNVAMIIEYFDRVVNAVENEDSDVYGNVGYALPPTKVGNPLGREHAFRSGPAVVSLFSRSQNKEAAYVLLQQAITSENQLDMGLTRTGYMPTKVPALDALAEEDPYVQYLITVSEQADALTDAGIMAFPSILRASDIGDVVSEAMANILTGAEVEPELQRAQESLQAIYQDLPQ